MKRALLVTLGLLLALLVTSCVPAPVPAPQAAEPAAKAPEPAQPAAEAPKEMAIGLVQIDLSHPFHLGEVEGAKEAARRYGFNLKVVSGEGDVNKQIQAFENLINEKVDAIAVNFIDFKAFGPAMAKAKAAGIPVVCLHSEPDGCAGFLGFDEWYTGNEVGKFGVSMLEKKYGKPQGKVANLQGLLGQGLNQERTGGWEEIMTKYPDIQVVAKEPTNWDPKRAVETTENWLTAYPDLDLIYGNSDGLTVPAADTVDRAGKLWDGTKGIIMTSVDGSDFALEAIKNGKLSNTFLYAPEYAGFWKAWAPFRIAGGDTVDIGAGPNNVKIKGVLVNEENVDTILKLAKDQKDDIQNFPFEKTLPEIIDEYMKK